MLRTALAAALVVAAPTFADEDEGPPVVPVAKVAAEAVVQKVRMQPTEADGTMWFEITAKVKTCIAGPCTKDESMTMRVPLETWRGAHGDVIGVVRYAWKDKQGLQRGWTVGLKLDDPDAKERFGRECEQAIASADQDPGPVAAR